MSDSREDSPDWVRSFKAPHSILTLSSGSDSPLDDEDEDEDDDEVSLSRLFAKDEKATVSDKNDEESPPQKASKLKLRNEKNDGKETPERKRKSRDLPLGKPGKNVEKGKAPKKSKPQEMNNSAWTLSSDSESCPDDCLVTDHHEKESAEYDLVEHAEEEESKVVVLEKDEKLPHNKASSLKSPKKQLKKGNQSKKEDKVVIKENDDEMNIREEDTTEKQGPQVSSSRLPLVLSEKVLRTKALVECEGDSIDLSGDVGAVGRLMISDSPSGDQDMLLDLKGTIYRTTIVPSQTFCVVSFGQSEAKIEAIMNDFIQLQPQSNVYDAETMVEGTLEGFSFDSEEEPDHPRTVMGQNGKDEAGEEQPKPKGKNKRKAEKTTGPSRKKAKPAGGKPPKKAKKTQVPQKSKARK